MFCWRAGADFVVGPLLSRLSEPTALLAGIEGVPQISYGSSSDSLSQKQLYPFFARTYPAHDLSAELLVGVLRSFRWEHVAILHQADAYGHSYRTALTTWGGSRLRVRGFSVDISERAEPMELAVAQIKQSQNNIIVTVLNDFFYARMLDAVAAQDMLTSSYAYILVDGEEAANDVGSRWPQLAGMLTWDVTAAESAGFERFADVWRASAPADCANDAFVPPADTFAQAPPKGGDFLYDAVAAIAIAIEGAGVTGGANSSARAAVLAQLLKSNFSGATGEVQFKSDGDRSEVGVTYALKNFVLAPNQTMTLLTARLVEATTERSLRPIVWLQGSDAPPDDALERLYPFGNYNATISVLVPLNNAHNFGPASGCAALLALRHVNEKNSSVVPQLANLSPNFRVRGLLYDTRTRADLGVAAYTRSVAAGADAIVGAAYSSVTVPVAQFSGISGIPQVSYGATAPVLSNKQLYPSFARTMPSDIISAERLVAVTAASDLNPARTRRSNRWNGTAPLEHLNCLRLAPLCGRSCWGTFVG